MGFGVPCSLLICVLVIEEQAEIRAGFDLVKTSCLYESCAPPVSPFYGLESAKKL